MRTGKILRLLSGLLCFALCAYIYSVVFHGEVSDVINDSSYGHSHVDTLQPNVIKSSDSKRKEDASSEINVLITFTGASTNQQLQSKFETTVESMFQFSTVKIQLYIIGDPTSQQIAKTFLDKHVNSSKYTVSQILREFLDFCHRRVICCSSTVRTLIVARPDGF